MNWKAFVACSLQRRLLAITVSRCMSLNIHFTLFLLLWQILSIYLWLKAFSRTNLKILPIFKAEDLSFFVNYRTISLLSIIFKFFEKVIYNLLVELSKNMVYFTAVSLDFGKITRHRTR